MRWPHVLLASLGAWAPGLAHALPVGPSTFCAQYPTAASCRSSAPDCGYCHTIPPTRNAYGAALAGALLPGTARPLAPEAFAAGLGAALVAIESADTDGDGASNLEEILLGTIPADRGSYPIKGGCPGPTEQLGWDPCGVDLAYTLKKISLSFCGHSPSRDQVLALKGASDPEQLLRETLDGCLRSEYWRGKDGVLWNLANRKIKPTQSIKSGVGAGDIPLADYEDDYNLFVYTQTDDRDVRELLTARYHVARADGPPTRYTAYTRTPREDVMARSPLQSQNVEESRRAGMLTTRWFLMSNTMFTGVPRTTAAQAYRAFLGTDIAKMEGLYEVAGEPIDYDNKGVQAEACARCHSTLDPLTYPFAYYSGIGGGQPRGTPAAYVDNRPARFTGVDGANMVNLPEQGRLFGQPVRDLVQWAQVAANSEAFAKATVLDYWRLLFGADPSPAQQEELDALWRGFMTTQSYRVEEMLRALVQTEAYRVP